MVTKCTVYLKEYTVIEDIGIFNCFAELYNCADNADGNCTEHDTCCPRNKLINVGATKGTVRQCVVQDVSSIECLPTSKIDAMSYVGNLSSQGAYLSQISALIKCSIAPNSSAKHHTETVLPDNTDSIKSRQPLSFYTSCKGCFTVAPININSVRHKLNPQRDVLCNTLIKILCIQESKLDHSFPPCQFEVPGYKRYLQDQSVNKRGIMVLIGSDIIHTRVVLVVLENARMCNDNRIEVMVFEVTLKGEKWLFSSVHKQPKVTDKQFSDGVEEFNACKKECPNLVVAGDINIESW